MQLLILPSDWKEYCVVPTRQAGNTMRYSMVVRRRQGTVSTTPLFIRTSKTAQSEDVLDSAHKFSLIFGQILSFNAL